ncbi:MAG: NfeD family protein [Pseudomonadota bacterium]
MSPALFYLVIAVVLIGTELLIMQLSVFWFLFIGLGALVASFAAWMFPDLGWVVSTGIFLVASIVISGGLYPWLKKWQSQPAPIAGNDAIGQTAEVIEAISKERPGKVMWSGADWSAYSSDEQGFSIGDKVIIRELNGIRLTVSR